MKREASFSRVLLKICPFLFLFVFLLGNGLGDWIFDTATDSVSTSVDYAADPIRENAVFGDENDYLQSGARQYDVYFMSQMCDIETHILEDTGDDLTVTQITSTGERVTATVNNYIIKDAPVPYTEEKTYSGVSTSDIENIDDYGAWKDDSGNLLDTDIAQSENRYFVRYESVSELTPDQVENLGNPSFYLADKDGWPLSFMCWTPCYDLPVYKRAGITAVFPSPAARQLTNYTTDWPGFYGRRMHGYAPYSSGFTSLYAGTVLEYYERLSHEGVSYTDIEGNSITLKFVYYVNGRPSIFFFPVYTSDGKNYIGGYGTNQNDTYKLVDRAITNTKDNPDGVFFNYDGIFSSAINDAFGSDYFTARGGTVTYECYRLSRRVFETDQGYVYNVIADPLRKNTYQQYPWWGNKLSILTMVPEVVSGDYINLYLVVKVDTAVNQYQTDTSGNEIKHQTTVGNDNDLVTIIDDAEYDVIDAALESQGIMEYYTRGQIETLAQGGGSSSDGNVFFSQYESRDYYMVYERFYTPKLVGGPSKTMAYADSGFTFTKEGVGSESHNWVLRNVDLSGDDTFDYSFTSTDNTGTERDVVATFPTTYFGVLVSPLAVQLRQRINYSLVVMDDDTTGTHNVPIFNSGTAKKGETTYYQSSSIFVDVFENPSLATDVAVTVDGESKTFQEAVNMGLTLQNDMNLLKVMAPGIYTLMFQAQFSVTTKFYDADFGELTFYDQTTGESMETAYDYGDALYARSGTEGAYTYTEVAEGSAGYPAYIIMRELPSSLYSWGYNFEDIFINICDITAAAGETMFSTTLEDGTVKYAHTGNTLQYKALTNQEYYVDMSSHTLHSKRYSYGATLTLEDPFYITETVGDTGHETQITTFQGIFDAIETYNGDAANAKDKELVDLVTGQVMTETNIVDFQIEKYYVFVIKYVNEPINIPTA